jgi:diaminohydroxyphosphoribosylaminopyrimidine deaminase/5-amino-6-(5-phosphoribosylamino)uracil reductase
VSNASVPSEDALFMEQALVEARKGRFWASPNPHVGCVVVKDNAIIGKGFTQPAGGAHAEVMALSACASPEDATVYVTLEPCAHHGRTGPCVDALINAGVGRVVGALEDPNPSVSGQGYNRLRSAGIDVTQGVCSEAAARELKGFLLRMERGWGRVRLKLGCSLDGRTAMASGESQWITGALARQDVQRQRAASSVIITGIGTVLADDCSLTVRSDELGLEGVELARALHRPPTRVVLDSYGRTPNSARVLSAEAPTLVITAPDQQPLTEGLHRTVRLTRDGLDLRDILKVLGSEGANEILLESGPSLAAAFLKEGLVDELLIYQAPLLLGSSARPLADLAFSELKDGIQLAYREVSRLGSDLRIIAAVVEEN